MSRPKQLDTELEAQRKRIEELEEAVRRIYQRSNQPEVITIAREAIDGVWA